MKFALRVFTMTIAFAGLTAASMSPASSQTTPNHLNAMVGPGPLGLPAPGCGPGIPTCPPPPPPGN